MCLVCKNVCLACEFACFARGRLMASVTGPQPWIDRGFMVLGPFVGSPNMQDGLHVGNPKP